MSIKHVDTKISTYVQFYPTVQGYAHDRNTVLLIRDDGQDPRGNSGDFWCVSYNGNLGDGFSTFEEARKFIERNKSPTHSGYMFKGIKPETAEIREVSKTTTTITETHTTHHPFAQ